MAFSYPVINCVSYLYSSNLLNSLIYVCTLIFKESLWMLNRMLNLLLSNYITMLIAILSYIHKSIYLWMNNIRYLSLHQLIRIHNWGPHSNAYNIVLNLKRLYSLVYLAPWYSYCFLNNIIVLITQSRLSIAQISSSFKWLDTRTSTSTTPTLITEALRHVTSLQLF